MEAPGGITKELGRWALVAFTCAFLGAALVGTIAHGGSGKPTLKVALETEIFSAGPNADSFADAECDPGYVAIGSSTTAENNIVKSEERSLGERYFAYAHNPTDESVNWAIDVICVRGKGDLKVVRK